VFVNAVTVPEIWSPCPNAALPNTIAEAITLIRIFSFMPDIERLPNATMQAFCRRAAPMLVFH
jgi:hypothetical protein